MSVFSLDSKNFEEKVLRSESPVLVDFWASWCGPCRMLSPVVEEVAANHPEVVFGKVNVDEVPELAERFQISAIPALLLFRDGKLVNMSVGIRSKEEIEEWIR